MHHKIQLALVSALGMGMVTAGPVSAASSPSPSGAPVPAAHADIKDVNGKNVGVMVVADAGGGKTKLAVMAKGLPPGYHGFHVHAVGVCDPASKDPATGSPFFSAGSHFTLQPGDHPDHSGDLPDLLVGQDGTGSTFMVTDRFSVDQLLDKDGSAVIAHALPDNQANIPDHYSHQGAEGPDATTLKTGDSGGRIACGVIIKR
ncbi:Cu-Zn family superoxide dismutase [Streptosporangium lutulentum]|uniref:Superoxide dismutase [Cu-Zn] n=2 Tax=Streptosporangium lutulentum TaxID=1461250 RepID=A0ABT9QS62_9ACTN|nr:superoxide dismutase family protein [Streptosporangium lutulentum]MDP9849526.1 Cu-Zn family superoxide dismutase [Streptosporangium lutulentum]